MSNELIEFNGEQLAIIKNMFCSNATDMEFKLFIEMAKALGLDPKKREIYFIKYGQGEKAKPTMIVGIDGYRKIAERSGKYIPGREPTFTYKNNQLFSATAYVKRLGPDKNWHEIGATAILSEYDAGQGQWKKMPHAMLAKCAESLALRRAFPSEMAGTYTEEEMEQAIDLQVNKETGEVKAIETHKIKEPTNSVDVGSKSVEKPKDIDFISLEDTIKLHNLIGPDEEYKQRIFDGYTKALGWQVKDFLDIPADKLPAIKTRIEQRNEQELKHGN